MLSSVYCSNSDRRKKMQNKNTSTSIYENNPFSFFKKSNLICLEYANIMPPITDDKVEKLYSQLIDTYAEGKKENFIEYLQSLNYQFENFLNTGQINKIFDSLNQRNPFILCKICDLFHLKEAETKLLNDPLSSKQNLTQLTKKIGDIVFYLEQKDEKSLTEWEFILKSCVQRALGNFDAAVDFLKKCNIENDAYAMQTYINTYLQKITHLNNYKSDQSDSVKLFTNLLTASDMGDFRASRTLGKLFLRPLALLDLPIKKDLARAKFYFKKAVLQGDIFSLFSARNILMQDLDPSEDLARKSPEPVTGFFLKQDKESKSLTIIGSQEFLLPVFITERLSQNNLKAEDKENRCNINPSKTYTK